MSNLAPVIIPRRQRQQEDVWCTAYGSRAIVEGDTIVLRYFFKTVVADGKLPHQLRINKGTSNEVATIVDLPMDQAGFDLWAKQVRYTGPTSLEELKCPSNHAKSGITSHPLMFLLSLEYDGQALEKYTISSHQSTFSEMSQKFDSRFSLKQNLMRPNRAMIVDTVTKDRLGDAGWVVMLYWNDGFKDYGGGGPNGRYYYQGQTEFTRRREILDGKSYNARKDTWTRDKTMKVHKTMLVTCVHETLPQGLSDIEQAMEAVTFLCTAQTPGMHVLTPVWLGMPFWKTQPTDDAEVAAIINECLSRQQI